MKNLINFFFSFDKMMKHKLVPAFYWATLIFLAIYFVRRFLTNINLEEVAWIITPLEGLALLVMAFVGLRLACELAIATFRISDNLSPDGGVSDTADIDPLAEARKAAEDAAKRAREMTSKAVDKTKSAASNMRDGAEKTADNVGDVVDDADDAIEEAVEKVKSAAKKTASPKKRAPAKKKTTTAKRTAAPKKTTAKKTTTRKRTTKKKNS